MTEESTVQKIADALLTSGLRRGGVVLVHSSLRSLGPVPGGAETVVRGFLCALGDEGTLLLPALSYMHVHARAPIFDVVRTPSNVGALPEYFRTRPGTLRSMHPTHSVCGTGPLAAELLAGHDLDTTPCGAHSPFRRLRDIGGQVLFLGCGLRPNTSMHAVEELVEPPYLFGRSVTYHLRYANGEERAQTYRAHDFAGLNQRYDRINRLLDPASLHVGLCLNANIHLLEADAMWREGLTALQYDPFYFVEPAH